MHEEALLRDLRRKVQELAKLEPGAEISRVALWVGALSHVTEETLRSRWPTVVEGTSARTARLEVEVSNDLDDPRASGIVLVELDVRNPDRPRPGGTPAPRAQEDPSP